MKNKPLYYLTTENKKSEINIPAEVPHTLIARALQDKTKRIAMYEDISDALCVLSIGRGDLMGTILSVYTPSYLNSQNILPADSRLSPWVHKLRDSEKWVLLDSLQMTKVCNIRVLGKLGIRKFKYGDRVLKKSSIKDYEMTEYSWEEVVPEWDKKGKTMKLKRKNFGKTAEKMTEDKPVAREAGLIGGSALIGLSAGLSALSAAERLDKATEIKGQTNKSWAKWEHERRRETAKKYIDKHAPAEKKEEVLKRTLKRLKKAEKKELEDIEKSTKRFRKITKPISKFAETKGGKAVLIGVPTAVIGGMVYRSAKKKKKSGKKEGEEK